MGVRRRGLALLDFETFRKKGCFLSFAWAKTNLTTFPQSRKILESPLCAHLENILPTPMQ